MNDVKKLLRDARREGWKIEQGKKHLKLTKEGCRPVVCSVTASDHRAAMNIRSDLRRAMK